MYIVETRVNDHYLSHTWDIKPDNWDIIIKYIE